MTSIYLEASEGAGKEKLSNTSMPLTTSFIPSTLTHCHYQKHQAQPFLLQDAFVLLKKKKKSKLTCILWGGGRETQSGFSPPNFSRSFLRPLPLKKKTIFDIQKYLYKYYLLVSHYSSFGCKL